MGPIYPVLQAYLFFPPALTVKPIILVIRSNHCTQYQHTGLQNHDEAPRSHRNRILLGSSDHEQSHPTT